MKNKNLRKLKRKDLLEIILEQTKRIECLEIELSKLKSEYEERKISISNFGSLAEASLELSGIFKAADEAVKIYIDNIQNQNTKVKDKKIKHSKFKRKYG